MAFFNSAEPILRRKQHDLDLQDQRGLIRLQLRIGRQALIDTVLTRVDQVFWGWALVRALIFGVAQFQPFAWSEQALYWTGLSLAAALWMAACTWFWAKVERAVWLVVCWAGLIASGLVLTDASISFAWDALLLHLGVLWLGISALGYLVSGIGLRSRALLICALLHLAAALLAATIPDWQFLIAGVTLSSCLALLGSTQWDMRLPTTYDLPQVALAFNRAQHARRQLVRSR